MMLVGMHPTEWDLPERDAEDLIMLFGMSTLEWSKGAHEERGRLAEAGQVRLRRVVSFAGESEVARPKASSFGKLVAALR